MFRHSCTTFIVVILALVACVAGEDDYYKILGVDRHADERTLKKNYRIQALKHHPDKGGSPEEFAKISEAYDALSDPEKRKVYDQYGSEGLKQHAAGGHPGAHQHGGFGGFGGGGFGGFGGGGFGGGRGGGARFEFHGDPFADFFGGGDPFGRGGGRGGRGGGRRHQHQEPPRQKDNLYGKNSPVTNLKQGHFPGTDAKNIWFVEFYAPWCGHCQELKPHFERLAKELKGFVRVGAVNCETQKGLCTMESVDSFPTLKLKKAGVSTQYDGNRELQQMKNWVLEQLPIAFANLRKSTQLLKFIETDCKPGAGCVVFLNKAYETPAWFKVASYAYRGKLPFAESRANNAEIALHFDITTQPTLVVVCDGDIDKTITYPGALDHDKPGADVEKWLAEYAAGGRGCSKVTKSKKQGLALDPSADFSKMKVGQIKALMQAHAIPCVSCYEKSDFVRAIQSHMANKAEL